MSTVLVTGSTGFVGRALTQRLLAWGVHAGVRAAVRSSSSYAPAPGSQVVRVASLDARTDWGEALERVAVVVHCAARVHVMREPARDALQAFREVNVQGTLNLARQAVARGVRRFIFVSSVKVNAEQSEPGRPLRASDVPQPQDPYGISKHEAEQALRDLAAQTGLELVVVRPPLVYGPGVRANFAQIMNWLARGWPLPLGAVTENRRSLVALDNLVDLLCVCTTHPAAAQQTFLVSDGEDVSTTQLLLRLGDALGRPARLWSVPPSWLAAAARVTGKTTLSQRLLGSLQVDISETQRILGWTPPVGLDEALRRCASARALA